MTGGAFLYAKPKPSSEGMVGLLAFVFAVMAVLGLSSESLIFLQYEGLMGLLMLLGYRCAQRVEHLYSHHLPRKAWRLYVIGLIKNVISPYWLVLAMGVIIIHYAPQGAKEVRPNLYYPPLDSWYYIRLWVDNILVIPHVQVNGVLPNQQFLPLSWWVGMMMVWALFAPVLYLFADVRRLCVLLTGYYMLMVYGALISESDYTDWHMFGMRGLFSGAFPFLVGMYAFRGQLSIPLERRYQAGAVFLWCIFMGVHAWLFSDPFIYAYGCVIVFSGWFLYQSNMEAMADRAFWLRHSCYFLGLIAYVMVLFAGPVMVGLLQLYPDARGADALKTVNMEYFWPLSVLSLSLFLAILLRMFLLAPLEYCCWAIQPKRHYPSAITPT